MTDESANRSPDGPTSPSQPAVPAIPKFSLRAIESAGFLAITTAIFYFMGYSYFAGFFGRLSLPPPYPELSTSDYFIRAFTNFASLFSLAMWIDNISNRFYEPTSWREAWRVNAPFFLIPIILGELAFVGGYLYWDVAFWLGAMLFVGAFGTVKKFSVVGVFTREGSGYGIGAGIMYALTFVLFFSIYFRAMGNADATKLIEGRKGESVTAIVQTADANSPVDGTPLLVALDRDSRLYLVRQESPAPERPTVYVIPENEIRSLTIQKTSGPPATPVSRSFPFLN